MRTPGAANWTLEKEATLRRLWEVEGLSSGDIAWTMGITRNAVIGKIFRLKLARHDTRRSPKLKPRARPARKASNKRRVLRPVLLAVSLPGDTTRLHGEAWQPLPGKSPVTLMEIDAGMCRWPTGEARPFLFCGHPAAHGSYCAHHAAVSAGYVPEPLAEAA